MWPGARPAEAAASTAAPTLAPSAEVPAPRWGADPSFAAAAAHEDLPAPARTWDDDDLDEPVRKHHPYTWLHLTVLAIVAFVLGFLIMLLANQGAQGTASDVDPAFTPPSSTSAVTVVTAALPAGPGGQDLASST